MLAAWHIEQGYGDGATLDGLNVALACHAPGHMKEGNWRAALYLDERADEAQRLLLALRLSPLTCRPYRNTPAAP